MPRPIAHANGVYHLNIRVPGDLAAKVKRTVVTLPVNGSDVTVRPSDMVILSLRTKDPNLAKARFSEPSRRCRVIGRPSVAARPLDPPAARRARGDCYRATVAAYEADPEFMPDGYLRAARMFEADVAAWRNDPSDGLGDIGQDEAVFLATLACISHKG